MKDELERILISKEEIEARVDEIAERINCDYAGKPYTLICTLKGGAPFFCDLLKRLDGDVIVDFIAVSSYGAGAVSSGNLKFEKDLSMPVRGRHMIIAEDIIDTGFTLYYLKRALLERDPLSVKICALTDKASRRIADVGADYVGFEVPDEFLVGYGMDFKEKYRNLPDIYALKKEAYEL